MAAVHARAWNEAGASVSGVWSHSQTRTLTFAERYGLTATSTFGDLCGGANLIDICTPTDSHREYAVQAASAGCQVVCEKPIALTLEDGAVMIRACQAAGVHLFVAQVARFYPEYQAAQRILASGEIGDLRVLRLKSVSAPPDKSGDNWYLDPLRSGGLLLDLMIHDFDYALWLGGPVSRVCARTVQPEMPGWGGDYALVTLRFASGALGQLEGGWVYPPGVFRSGVDVAGSAGLVEYHSDQAQTLHRLTVQPSEPEGGGVALPLPVSAADPFTRQCRHILDVLAGKSTSQLMPQDALAALELALAARTSAQQGRPLRLGEER